MLVKTDVFANHVKVAFLLVHKSGCAHLHQITELPCDDVFADFPHDIFDHCSDLIFSVFQDYTTRGHGLIKATSRVLWGSI